MAPRYDMLMERNTGIPMRDGAILRGDVFRPKAEGRFPVAHDLRALRQGRAAQGIHGGSLGRDRESLSRDSSPFLVPASGVGNARSRGLGSRWLYHHPRRCARLRQVAGPARAQLAGGIPRLLRRDRMGGRAALVQRQGRAYRHFLSCGGPVARRVAEAAASRRVVPVDGHLRFLPRPHPPGRHLRQRLHQSLVDAERASGTSTAIPNRPITTSIPAGARPES